MTSSNGKIPALLALCEGNSPVTGEFPSQRAVTWSFDVFFDLRPNKPLSKQWWGCWFQTPSLSLWPHCNVEQQFTCFPFPSQVRVQLINAGHLESLLKIGSAHWNIFDDNRNTNVVQDGIFRINKTGKWLTISLWLPYWQGYPETERHFFGPFRQYLPDNINIKCICSLVCWFNFLYSYSQEIIKTPQHYSTRTRKV